MPQKSLANPTTGMNMSEEQDNLFAKKQGIDHGFPL